MELEIPFKHVRDYFRSSHLLHPHGTPFTVVPQEPRVEKDAYSRITLVVGFPSSLKIALGPPF